MIHINWPVLHSLCDSRLLLEQLNPHSALLLFVDLVAIQEGTLVISMLLFASYGLRLLCSLHVSLPSCCPVVLVRFYIDVWLMIKVMV